MSRPGRYVKPRWWGKHGRPFGKKNFHRRERRAAKGDTRRQLHQRTA